MKVKLLKKVRRRFTITKINSIGSNAGYVFKNAEIRFGTPFYHVKDKHEVFISSVKKTYSEALDKLWLMILRDYGENFIHKECKTEKVWWKKPNSQ